MMESAMAKSKREASVEATAGVRGEERAVSCELVSCGC